MTIPSKPPDSSTGEISGSRANTISTSPSRLDRLLKDRPDLSLTLPFFVYLLLLSGLELRSSIGEQWVWLLHLLRGVGGIWAVWLVRRHLPPWGRPHLALAIGAGLLAAFLWVAIHKLALALGLPHPMLPALFGHGKPPEEIDPFRLLPEGGLVWVTIAARILVAATTVAFVEELFWRGFLLRGLIDWDNFQRVPLGSFTWKSFLLSSAFSTLEHPGHWCTSIFCWFLFNGLFYWKRSLLFMVLVHGLTNLFLYVYVVAHGDWMFW
jgi:CAAX prenyl protease-like protein